MLPANLVENNSYNFTELFSVDSDHVSRIILYNLNAHRYRFCIDSVNGLVSHLL